MGKTLESVFVSEFRQEVSNIGYKDIYKIPLPDEIKEWEVSGTEVYAVRGISESNFNLLNGTIVRKIPKGYSVKRRVIDKVTKSYAKSADGSYVYEDFVIPAGSMAVCSTVKIGLSYSEYKKKVNKNGYGYVDMIQTKRGTEFIYVLPKTVVYRVNQIALALSVVNMKNYTGCGYVTWNYGTIFLHVIPYNPNSVYSGSKILKTSYGSLNFNSEIRKLLDFWQNNNVIPRIELCALSDGTNLAVKGTTVGYDSFIPVEPLSLGDREIYGADRGEILNE